MKKRIWRVLTVLLALMVVICVGRLVWQLWDYQRGDEIYAAAEELAGLPDLSELPLPTVEAETPQASGEPVESVPPEEVYVDPYADALREMDFAALREVNDQVLGWLLIPGTKISYPLVQGEDNDYYLNHTWRGTRSTVGAIFLEQGNRADMSDFNTIIYGHRMSNGSMFGSLKYYNKQSYWSAHPYIYLTNDSGTHRYEIFAAYEADVTGLTYRLGFSGDAAKQEFLDACLAQSVIDTGVVPTIYDRILTLSTCTGGGYATRWVVQAVAWGEHPAEGTQAPEESVLPDESAPPAESALPETVQPTAQPEPEVSEMPGDSGTAEP